MALLLMELQRIRRIVLLVTLVARVEETAAGSVRMDGCYKKKKSETD